MADKNGLAMVAEKADYTICILVIEDHFPDYRLIAELLKDGREADKFVFKLLNAPTLADAHRLLRTGNFDLVLLDIFLPDSDDLNGLIEIKKQYRDLPIIILSGLEDKEVAMTSIAKGADNFIIKNDVSRKRIIEALEFAIGRKRRNDDINPDELMLDLQQCREKRKQIAGKIRDANREDS